MTSPLRKKRRTTARGRNTPARTAASLLGLGLFLAGTSLPAQTPPAEHPAPWPSALAGTSELSGATPSSSLAGSVGQGLPPVSPQRDLTHEAPFLTQAAPPPPSFPSRTARPPKGLQSEESEQQAPMMNPRGGLETDERTPGYQIQLEPPGPERLFKLDSEAGLHERWQQEANDQQLTGPIQFPAEPVLSKNAYRARVFPPNAETVEPNYVCYKRLFFEDLNSERYGWDLGFIQPFVSAGKFFCDVATLPYHAGTEPCRKYECSAGYCLPGDPVPYLIYPPELSVTGAVLEAGTIVALYGIFPG